jgi:hypothetical protein
MGSGGNAVKTTKKNAGGQKIPLVCQFWSNLQRSLPSIQLFGLDVNLTLATAIFLALVRYGSEFVMENVFNWPANSMTTKIAAASVSSIFDSLNLVPTLYVLFRTTSQYNPSAPMAEEKAGSWWNETVTAMLQFCTGYMLYDGFLNIIWLKTTMQAEGVTGDDWVFLGHHAATILYMTSTRLVGAGVSSNSVIVNFSTSSTFRFKI